MWKVDQDDENSFLKDNVILPQNVLHNLGHCDRWHNAWFYFDISQ